MRFVDTNVLLYAVSLAPEEEPKRRVARNLLTRTDLALSAQVLQEFYVQATRATGPAALTHRETVDFMEALQRFPIQPITLDVVLSACVVRQRFGLSYWDSAILAAARISDCTVVYSEDMNAGQNYDGVRVINPFSTPVVA